MALRGGGGFVDGTGPDYDLSMGAWRAVLWLPSLRLPRYLMERWMRWMAWDD